MNDSTAKAMNQVDVALEPSTSIPTSYVLIPQSALYYDKPLAFDIYIRLSSRHVKIFKRGDFADRARIDSYNERADNVLYIDSATLEAFMDERFGTMFQHVTSNALLESRLKAFVQCTELCYLDLKLVRLSADKFMRLDLLSNIGYEFCKKPLVHAALLKQSVSAVGSAFSRRAVFGSLLGLAIFSAQNDCTQATFRSLFLGSLLRDLGLPLTEGIDLHRTVGSEQPESHQEFFMHPERSVEILREYSVLDDMMKHLILQHHEQPLGTGFPRGIKRAETFVPAQNLSLADWLVTLVENVGGPKFTVQKEIVLGHLNEKLPEENRRYLAVLTKLLGGALK